MFNKTFVSTPAPVVHVHNETKPHDPADAARLYGQLRERAEAEVAEAIVERLGAHNEIKVVATQSRFETDQMRVLFAINGIQFDFEIDRADLAWRFYEITAQALSVEILKAFRKRLSVSEAGDANG